METARKIIDEAWEDRANINPSSALKPLREAVEYVIAGLIQDALGSARGRAAAGSRISGSRRRYCFRSVSRTTA